jgi:hypothetical protein
VKRGGGRVARGISGEGLLRVGSGHPVHLALEDCIAAVAVARTRLHRWLLTRTPVTGRPSTTKAYETFGMATGGVQTAVTETDKLNLLRVRNSIIRTTSTSGGVFWH